jgi:hypothetical protein
MPGSTPSWKTAEGSTGRLLQLCVGYFTFYTITGIVVKYYLGSSGGLPGMSGIEYLTWSTLGSFVITVGVVFARRWYRLQSNHRVQWGRLDFPVELLYIVPSGVCTAVVIPTTTLMYTLPISVMVAMVIMRGSVIVVSRIVDAILIRQGLLHKRVYWQENLAVVFALVAVAAKILWTPAVLRPFSAVLETLGISVDDISSGGFEFLRSRAALTIFCSYIAAYAIRIYIMNYYKNTRGKGTKQNNTAFFAIEQIAATLTLLLVVGALLAGVGTSPQAQMFRDSVFQPHSHWKGATITGTSFGLVAFFSVFIFMFKGRTATFAGLVNRLTSLVAGTTATLVFHFAFGGRFPEPSDWLALFFILVAVGFLTRAETRRRAELQLQPD